MDGREFVQLIEKQLVQQGISKAKFYEDCGLSSAVFSNWRKNINAPSQKNINTIFKAKSVAIFTHGEADSTLRHRI